MYGITGNGIEYGLHKVYPGNINQRLDKIPNFKRSDLDMEKYRNNKMQDNYIALLMDELIYERSKINEHCKAKGGYLENLYACLVDKLFVGFESSFETIKMKSSNNDLNKSFIKEA